LQHKQAQKVVKKAPCNSKCAPVKFIPATSLHMALDALRHIARRLAGLQQDMYGTYQQKHSEQRPMCLPACYSQADHPL
jgi:hypothetical protein